MKSLRQKMAARQQRYASQVQAESTLRFGPEQSTIRSQQGDLRDRLAGDLAAARTNALGIQSAARQAEPRLIRSYGDAAGVLDRVVAETRAETAGLAPNADRIKAATERDVQGTKGRLAESLAGARAELAQRAFDAEAGRVNAVSNARSAFRSDSSKLAARVRDLANEQGAFAQARSGELGEQAADRRFKAREGAKSRHNARLTAGVDAQGHVIKGGPKDKPGEGGNAPRLSADKHAETRAKLGTISSVAKTLVDNGTDYHKAVQLIQQGAPDRKEEKTVDWKKADALRKQNPNMTAGEAEKRATVVTRKAAPGFDGVGDEALARAVVDVARDGHVSRKTAQMLHAAGYSAGELGLPTYTSTGAKPKPKPSLARPGNAPSGRGRRRRAARPT